MSRCVYHACHVIGSAESIVSFDTNAARHGSGSATFKPSRALEARTLERSRVAGVAHWPPGKVGACDGADVTIPWAEWDDKTAGTVDGRWKQCRHTMATSLRLCHHYGAQDRLHGAIEGRLVGRPRRPKSLPPDQSGGRIPGSSRHAPFLSGPSEERCRPHYCSYSHCSLILRVGCRIFGNQRASWTGVSVG